MSIEAMVWVLNHSRSRSTDRLVALVLANYANDDDEAWPSTRTLAAKAAVAKDTVTDALARLVTLGELVKVDPGSPRHSARYRFTRAVENQQSSVPYVGRSPESSGADIGRSVLPTGTLRPRAIGTDPLVTHTEKDLAAGAGNSTVDIERGESVSNDDRAAIVSMFGSNAGARAARARGVANAKQIRQELEARTSILALETDEVS